MRFGLPQIIIISAVLTAGIILLLRYLPTPEPAPVPTHLTVQQQRGFALVTSYCADCHAVGETDDSLNPASPKFRDLHERYDVTFLEEALVEGLVAHPDMPEFEFDADQAEAIIEYLETLQS